MQTTTEPHVVNTKPIQTLSWSAKMAKKQEWFKRNIDYGVSNSSFSINGGKGRRDLDTLYDVYNNKFPMKWFTHVTDPLSAKVAAHKAFPAKVRPVTILRTNIDLLISEYPRRPFIYTVNNLGEDGYNAYTQELNKKLNAAIQGYFQQLVTAAMTPEDLAAQGEAGQEPPPPPIPEEIKKQHHATYKDAIAIKAQKWLRRALREYRIRPKILKMFKDWLIVGEAYSYKGLSHGTFKYEHISPKNIDFIRSEGSDFIEDAERIVCKRLMTTADVVDEFYEDLSKQDILDMEQGNIYRTPTSFYEHMSGQATGHDLHEVWHVCWKSRKGLNILHYTDPFTGQPQEDEVDEDYPVDKEAGEWIEKLWPNEGYEGWRVGTDKYLRMQPIPVQRNEMNNCSKLKMPYNGRLFSDTHSENTSVLEIGIPFQIMYIIVTRTLELTIAKSKGKILLIDKAAIPTDDDWDEEKFFYYAEALGYGLLKRNQIGVDKSWNQYQVLDMGMFADIKQLIELQDHFKQQWDDVMGINRQRKGQTYASDLVGVNERATFQSTVMTDTIFNLFEEFVETELQGIIDFSKFVNINGVKAMYNDDVYGNQLLEIDPNTYCNADLGVLVESSAEAIAMKNKVESGMTAMLQNAAKPSTIVEILKMQSLPELQTKLKEIEEIQARQDQQGAANEEEAAKAADDRARQFAEYENMLKTTFMNDEYDRKEDIEYIRGDFNTYSFKDGDSNMNGQPDALEVMEHNFEREKFQAGITQQNADRSLKASTETAKLQMKDKEMRMKEVQSKRQAKKAAATKK